MGLIALQVKWIQIFESSYTTLITVSKRWFCEAAFALAKIYHISYDIANSAKDEISSLELVARR